eukprot:4717732-Prymnesium_polylepis.1
MVAFGPIPCSRPRPPDRAALPPSECWARARAFVNHQQLAFRQAAVRSLDQSGPSAPQQLGDECTVDEMGEFEQRQFRPATSGLVRRGAPHRLGQFASRDPEDKELWWFCPTGRCGRSSSEAK